ncbi:MAG: DUF4829 domain-containing protein [Romboutsia sp.]
MLIFTFIITVNSQTSSTTSNISYPQKIIHQYFNYIDLKDTKSIEKLVINKEDVLYIESIIDSIKHISIINVKEEENKSIIKAYLKNNTDMEKENLKVYKVKYKIDYTKESGKQNKSGFYENWYFIVEKSPSIWMIDIGEI